MGAAAITLRQGLEAPVLVGLMSMLLPRDGRREARIAVWIGSGLAVLLGAGIGLAVAVVGPALGGKAEAVWEAATMVLAASLLIRTIFSTRRRQERLERQLGGALAARSSLRLVRVAFMHVAGVAVVTALLLFGWLEGRWGAADLGAGPLASGIGALVGLVAAAGLSHVARTGSAPVDLRRLLGAVNGAMLLFAAFEVANALHTLGNGRIMTNNEQLRIAVFVVVGLATSLLLARRHGARSAR